MLKLTSDFESVKEVLKLTTEQKSRIAEAQEEYITGNVLLEADANKEIKEWLEE